MENEIDCYADNSGRYRFPNERDIMAQAARTCLTHSLDMAPLGALLLLLVCGRARAQYDDDPTLFFKPFEFDTILRGQYNVSQCVLDLINCWEYMRPDVMCSATHAEAYDVETYCAMNKMYCSDAIGDYDGYLHRFIAFTGYCQDNWQEWHQLGHWT